MNLSIVTAIMAGTAAAMTQLPYSWAHAAAFGISTAIAGIHTPTAVAKASAVQPFWKGKNNG